MSGAPRQPSEATPPTEPVLADPPDLTGRRVMTQRWTELAYFHWRYPPDVVQRLLPDGVRVDTFDGSAWVGLIPFVMRDVRLGPTPAVPYLGTFVEINVRTYVVDPLGRRSVWFFSLDVPRSMIVAVARTVFALPYCWSATEYGAEGDDRRYTMSRRWPRQTGPRADIRFTMGDLVDEVEDLDNFLTARWALLTSRRGRLVYGRVHHERWPLRHVDGYELDQTVIEAAGLPTPEGPPRTACSESVGVGVSWFETLR